MITSLVAFISTNIDDIFVLTLFFGNKQFKEREIIFGQFIGIISLIVMSLAVSLAGLLLSPAYIGLLGLLPIYWGAKSLWNLKSEEEDDRTIAVDKNKNNVLAVAGVTIANGGDNIGIYVPMFAALDWPNKITMITVFLLMTIVWCLAAKYLVKHPYVEKIIDKYGHVVTPFVLILLGIYILYENGTFGLLMR